MSDNNELLKKYLVRNYSQLFDIIDKDYDYDELKSSFVIDTPPKFDDDDDKKKKKLLIY